ncbi:MAG: tetraacyldisaccharide 4'-kinase [Deltaproteobacteria bacterium]|nr:tetraacyldisaccharide 4'-kinase [Deltaproteobacteria bacterium]
MNGKIQPSVALNLLLTLLSKAYGTGVKLRRNGYASGFLKSKKLPCIVISIGNLTTGGTGKTPMVIHVAERVRRWGYRVAVISRGYKGAAEKDGGIVSDENAIRMDANTAGDEPFLLATSLKGIPVLVGRDRYQSGMLAIDRFQAQVVILDDAFQHLALFRDLNLLLLDSTLPFGNGHLLPRGTLREPASTLRFSDALIMTRSFLPFREPAEPWAMSRPVFCATHEPFFSRRFLAGEKLAFHPHEPVTENALLIGKRYFAFSGIAKNDDFLKTLQKMGADVRGFQGFSDHHFYSDEDMRTILDAAVNAGATTLATTEKDLSRLHGRFQLPMECVVIGIRMSLDNTMGFDRFIQNRLSLTP